MHDQSQPVSDGYVVEVGSKKYYFDTAARVSKKRAHNGDELLVMNGAGYESAFYLKNNPQLKKVSSFVASAAVVPSAAQRVPHYLPPACGDPSCGGGGGGSGCDASQQTCGPCPLCDGPENYSDGTVDCAPIFGCKIMNPRTGSLTSLDADSGVSCVIDISSLSLDCSYNQANQPPNRPPQDITWKYLYNAPINSWNLFCNPWNQLALVKVTFSDAGGTFNMVSFVDTGEQGVWAHIAFMYPEKSSMKAMYYVDSGPKYVAVCKGSS
ncbi:MAG TPA: hypothetical protein VK669_01905 [Candidatus Limnocylindrales bacterium]|nr:hypothetical protein [Candidatus Limnocylindrales bacterium]